MKIIDAVGIVLGRLASYAAKEALKGEEIVIVNCSEAVITGNKKTIEKEFVRKRSRVGSGQRGPKHSKTSERIVKRAIRGMLPTPSFGRGKEAFKKIKCYDKIPKEFEGKEFTRIVQDKKIKINKVEEFVK